MILKGRRKRKIPFYVECFSCECGFESDDATRKEFGGYIEEKSRDNNLVNTINDRMQIRNRII